MYFKKILSRTEEIFTFLRIFSLNRRGRGEIRNVFFSFLLGNRFKFIPAPLHMFSGWCRWKTFTLMWKLRPESGKIQANKKNAFWSVYQAKEKTPRIYYFKSLATAREQHFCLKRDFFLLRWGEHFFFLEAFLGERWWFWIFINCFFFWKRFLIIYFFYLFIVFTYYSDK